MVIDCTCRVRKTSTIMTTNWKQYNLRNFLDSTLVDKGREGPERGAKRRSAEGRGVWGGIPSMGVWGYAPRKIFRKINVEIAYFSSFLQAKMHRRRRKFFYSAGAPPLLPCADLDGSGTGGTCLLVCSMNNG